MVVFATMDDTNFTGGIILLECEWRVAGGMDPAKFIFFQAEILEELLLGFVNL